MKKILFFLIILFPNNALAWTYQQDGPDVFGNTKVIATSGGLRESLVVQCNSKDELLIAFVFRKKEFQEINEIPAKLLLQKDKETPISITATLRSWNDNYAGIVAQGRTEENIAIIEIISKAKRKINVGTEILGNQFSASFSARGSSRSMKKVFSGCKLATE